jgi:anti-anti-sigma regulatory factor
VSELTVRLTRSSPRRHRWRHRLANADELDAALAGLSGEVALDCTDVTFISSSGFDALDRGYRAALARGGTFTVLGMTSFQRRIAAILSVPYVR